MLVEAEKLRWLGVDMRPRWRRQVAVVGTYLVMSVVIVWFSETWKGHVYWAMVGVCLTTMGLGWVSVLRSNGIVKKLEERRSFKMRGVGEVVMVNGLDEWAQYLYGVSDFESASAEQKDELLSRFKMGTRWFPKKGGAGAETPWLDEREIRERDSAERWTLRTVTGLLAAYAGIYASRAAGHRVVPLLNVAMDFWGFAVLAMTLPRARVLWTERDPREMGGELGVVGGVEA